MDFYIIQLSLSATFTFLVAITVTLFIFFAARKSKSQPNFKNAIPVFEIVRALEDICPINTSNKWKLFPSEYGCHRCWTQSVSLSPINKNVSLCGSTTTISSSSTNICSLIADVTKWPEWNPFYSFQYIIKSFSEKQLRRDHYMEAEQIVSIVRETNKILPHTIMYRFHDFSENKVGWILFWNPNLFEFLYFLIQPVKNKNEGPLCLLTHIVSTESRNISSSISVLLQRLRNIQDMISHSSFCIVPSAFTSSVHPTSEASISHNKFQTSNNTHQENYFSLSTVRARKREARNTIFVLVPFIPHIFKFWKRDIKFKLAVRNMALVLEKKPDIHEPKVHVSITNKCLIKRPLRRATSDVGMKSKFFVDINKDTHSLDVLKDISLTNSRDNSGSKEKFIKRNSDTSEDSETKNNSCTKEKIFSSSKLRSLSETAVNNLDCEFSNKLLKDNYNQKETSKLPDISENVEENVLAMDEQSNKDMFQSSISDFEIVENCEFTENRIAGFLTQGNYGAAELQTEALLASQFADDMNSGNFQTVGGWMFHSYHKGLCVFTKTTCNKFLKICSFLCQTEISVAPKDIWKFVKNPQFRFICDESVKSVEVLEKISSSQKLIHTYHEIGGLIRKELTDFCLLQTEREELNRYYSCFHSIEFDKCPFMKLVTRGTLRPSGWIVEKIDEDANKSIVTYIMQVLISSSDSMFIQELSTMVPQSVYNLKNYITAKPI